MVVYIRLTCVIRLDICCAIFIHIFTKFPTSPGTIVEYAIKIIPISPAMANNNKHEQWNEIETLQRLSCPYVVSFIEGFIYDDEVDCSLL